MSAIKLPYLGNNAYAEIYNTPNGYQEVTNLDKYNNSIIRNTRIFRVDLLYYLNDYFELSTIRKYRAAIYYIISGIAMMKSNKDLIAKSLESLYKEDPKFKIFIGKVYYFRDTEDEELSLYEAIVTNVNKSILSLLDELPKKIPSKKYIINSQLYLYFSIDSIFPIEELMKVKGLEVISR
jgi:hypothetical protein